MLLSRVSEIFYSIQGEGSGIGRPSLFVRFFGCNFRCPGFGLPLGEFSTEPDEIAKRVDEFKSYDELPLAKTGCDSYPSWHPKFAKFSPEYTVDELYERMINSVPSEAFSNTVDIVFTGGEPLLPKTQKFIIELFHKHDLTMFKSVTFETNGTMKVSKDLIDAIESQIPMGLSVSPKLKCSGVSREKAIVPSVLADNLDKIMYLKFVVSNKEDLDEVNEVVGIVRSLREDAKNINVYIMPEGGTPERYNQNLKKIAELALREGYILSPRLHVTLFGNTWGT